LPVRGDGGAYNRRVTESDQRRRWIVLALVLFVVSVITAGAFVAQRVHIATSEHLRETDRAENRNPPVVTWEGRTFRRGDRVRIVSRAGTFKPAETKIADEIEAGPGQRGTVMAGERRTSTEFVTFDPGEPIQIVRVRWDAQSWSVSGGRIVDLEAFEATIHVSYLEILPRSKVTQ
jgi:hypothetical protein